MPHHAPGGSTVGWPKQKRSGGSGTRVKVSESRCTGMADSKHPSGSETAVTDLEEIGGEPQSAVDVANAIDQLQDTLASVKNDQLRTDIQNNNAGLLESADQPFDVSAAEVDADVATNTVGLLEAGDQPLDVSAAEVSVDAATNTAGLLEAADQPLDVSAATVTVDDSGNFVVSSLPEPLNVSAAEVDVDLNANTVGVLESADQPLDVSDATVPTEQQTPIGVEDSTGGQIDPSLATDYLDSQTAGHDLVGSGDLTIGPSPVKRGTAVVIAATSTDNNAFSVSVDWQDSAGNVYQSETASDIGLSTITEDYARLVRKAPQVVVTVTDESGAAQNIINIHADTER